MPEILDLSLPSGRVRVERSGPADGDAVLCVHGLTANLRSFDRLVEPLTEAGRQVVAVDLRGRGRSEDTGPGTYGREGHVHDVIAVVDQLGFGDFDYVGWSMGALVGLGVSDVAASRMRTVSLLDAVGGMDPEAIDLVRAGTARLDAVVPDVDTYLTAVKASGVFDPWDPFWEAYFSYELAELPDGAGLSPSTSRAACLEDISAAEHDFTPLWGNLTMPTLLVWANVPLGGGLIVPVESRDAFMVAVPHAVLHEVDRNHYGIMIAPGVPEAIVAHITG